MSASNRTIARGSYSGERPINGNYTIGFNVGVIAAPFNRGPVEEIVDISSERQLVNILVVFRRVKL